ncbi:MAG TPA: hypothetical protein VKB65_08605 [Myxococcota bacterium]|nr:hypothetical protein [Myxococcota bacterium]
MSPRPARIAAVLDRIVLPILVVAKLCVVAWGASRGFELGDEGFFLLNLNDPAASPRFFEFYKLLLWLPGPHRFDVLDARWLHVGAEAVASVALVGGVWAWARRERFAPGTVSPLAFAASCGLGVFVSAASRSLSYNDATNVCLQGAMGALFAAAALGPGRPARLVGAVFVAGFLAGFQVFVKFPAALALAVLSLAALGGALGRWTRRTRAGLLGAWLAGVLAAGALFVAANGGVAPLSAKLAGAAEVGALAGYDPVAMVRQSLGLEVWSGVNLLVLVAVFAVARLALRRFAGASDDVAFAGAALAGAAAMAATVRPLHAAFASASLTAFSCLVAFVSLALLVVAWRARGAEPGAGPARGLAPALVLLALPLAAWAGTNVPFVWRLPSHAFPAFVAIALLSHGLRARRGRVATHAAVAALLALVTSAVFVRHQLVSPYGLRAPLWEQVHPDAGLPGMRVDLASHRFLSEVAETFADAGFRPGDPVVAMDYMPGLVFYLGGRSPGFPFYAFDREALNCFNLNRSGLVAPPWLILGREVSEAQRDCIEVFDLDRDFRLLRTLRFPYEDVYAGFGGRGLSHVTLWAPRSR